MGQRLAEQVLATLAALLAGAPLLRWCCAGRSFQPGGGRQTLAITDKVGVGAVLSSCRHLRSGWSPPPKQPPPPPPPGSQPPSYQLPTWWDMFAGNEASRARLIHDVGYDTLATIVQARMGPGGAALEVMQQVLTLALEVSHLALSAL